MAILLGAGEAPAALPSGFVRDVVADDLTIPTQVEFLPDGRLLIAEKDGVVRVVDDGTLLSTPLLDFRTRVNNNGDRGLLGIAVDPDFATNGFVYLYYAFDYTSGHANPPSGTARLTRVTVTGNTASGEVVLLGTDAQAAGSSCKNLVATADCVPAEANHTGGKIVFAPDGTLFLSTGDGTSSRQASSDALRAQDLDSLGGKILRVTKAGAGVPSNPFWNESAGANRSKVWAYGLRNPFRFNLYPGSSQVAYVGDVGWHTREEVSVARPGDNLGWPCYEGNVKPAGYSDMQACLDLYAQGSAAVRAPLYAYSHSVGSTVIGGAFYTGSAYPSQYRDAYFFGDYTADTLTTLRVDSGHKLVSGSVDEFGTAVGGPVAIDVGPDGNVYYVALNEGRVYRLRFTGGNRPPVAAASGSPTSGLTPLTVRFSSGGSNDPDGDSLSYLWDFGDGTADSTQPNPTHVYRGTGNFAATLTISDGKGGSDSDVVRVSVGQRAPTATITRPLPSLRYRRGDTIQFAGKGVDAEDGALPGARLSWRLVLHHCPPGGMCHAHPSLAATGAAGRFEVPLDHEESSSFFELTLTVTDRAGLTDTASALIRPALIGTNLSETLLGSRIRDVVYGLGGNDHVRGLRGADDLWGQRGNDVLSGGMGTDRLFAGRGNDRLYGGPRRDLLVAGPGRDRIFARGGGQDTIRCGAGRDFVRADFSDRVAGDCEVVARG